MKLTIKYFAAFREKADKNEEIRETKAQTASQLYDELRQEYNFHLDSDHVKVAINESYEDFTYPLNDNDTVVFIPPVAGG